MAKRNYHIVVSWTGGDDTDPAQYMVAIYRNNNEGAPCDFVTIDDTNALTWTDDGDRTKIHEAINAYVVEYNLDADCLHIEWDV